MHSKLLGLALLSTLVACSSPPTRYYTLSEHPGAAAAVAPLKIGVYVADVVVPESADRQPLVVSDGGNRVRVQEFDQWAAPLDGQITRVVVGNLRQILGVQTVASEADLVGEPKALRLRLVIERFDARVGATTEVRARWSIARADRGVPVVGTATVTHEVAGERLDDVVTGWNAALWEVSQDVARSLVAASRPDDR